MYRYLILLVIASTIGLQGWQTLFNNFAVEIAGLQGVHVGTIQSVREIPGFLALLAVYVMLVVSEHKLAALSILFLGVGLGVTGIFPSFAGLILTTLISSFGYHYYETVNKSLTLQYFDKLSAPLVFGNQSSIAAITNIGVGVFIYGVSLVLAYREIYAIFGLLIIGIGIWALRQNPTRKGGPVQHYKMVFRKKYWLFYFLTFMSGARRQIFLAFAVFLLVERFKFTIQEITVLFVVNNIIRYFLAPLIGKGIVRLGERWVLSVEYFGLIFVFIAYAFTDSKLVVSALYLLDHIFFNFSIAINTYFQKVGDPRDIAPSMAVGFTINHIAAVFLPVIGGLLWMVDYKIPFLAGAGMSLVSFIAVQKISIEK
jgi:hypothetical protein